MTDLRGTYTPDSELDDTGNTMFKIVAAIIVLLALGAVGAYYLGTDMLQQHQPTRLALAPANPISPVIAPRMTTPSPALTQSSLVPSAPKPASSDTASVIPPHVRKHTAQQGANLQPRPAALQAPTPPTSTEPALVPPPAVDANAPAQDPAPAQPAAQP